MKKLFKSLRSRIILFLILFTAIPFLILHFGILGTFETHLLRQRMIEVNQRGHIIASDLGQTEKVENAIVQPYLSVLEGYSDAYGGRLMVVDDSFRVVLDTYKLDTGKECISDIVFKAREGTEYQHYNRQKSSLEYAIPINYSGSSEKKITGVLIFSSTTEWIHESYSGTRRVIILIELILFSIILFFSLYISYVLVHPVNRFADQLRDFSDGHRDTVPAAQNIYSELDSITESTQEIVHRYQEIDRTQEEFVSNASHELRTPMTSIRVLSDSLIGQENIPEETYQEFLTDISVEIDREARIIEDLLTMTKIGKASDSLNIQNIDINEFVLDLLKSIRPIASRENIELVYESFRQVNADVDSTKLNQAFSNLVENAVKYNNPGGYVKVSLDADRQFFYLKVSDNGVGIPEDAIPYIFDRFYRVDKARSRDTGGTGLGLAITRSIILQHHGIIKVESVVNEGTTFTVRIPLKFGEIKED